MRIKINIQRYSLSDLWLLRRPIAGTLIRPRKVANLFKSKLSEKLKRDKTYGQPQTLLIEPSTYCNLKCPMCPRSYMSSPADSGNMNLEAFSGLMDEIGDRLMFLLIFGNGEPLMNPHIMEIIRLAKKKNVFVVLSTNGVLLSEDKVHEMLECPPDLLVFSIDAVTEDTYEKYRTGGDFNKVVSNIRYLAGRKRRLGKKTPLIDIQFLAMKENEAELKLAEQLVENTGADKYSIKKVSSFYTDPEREKVQDFLPVENQDLAFSAYVSSSPPGSFCTFPWKQTAVNWDGAVIPCCKDIDVRHDMGNVFDGKPLKEIWNNPQYMEFRRQVKNNIDEIDICRTCNRRAEGEIFYK